MNFILILNIYKKKIGFKLKNFRCFQKHTFKKKRND